MSTIAAKLSTLGLIPKTPTARSLNPVGSSGYTPDLLGTQRTHLTAPAAIARAVGRPYESNRACNTVFAIPDPVVGTLEKG